MKYLISIIIFLSAVAAQAQFPGEQTLTNSRQVQLPYNRIIQPAGKLISFGLESLENHALDAALSPNGKVLAVMERYSIIFIDTHSNKVLNRLPNSGHPVLKGAMNTLLRHNMVIYRRISDSILECCQHRHQSFFCCLCNMGWFKSRIFKDI